MPHPTTTRAFELRHLQLARAFFAAVAAVMITFSADHSAPVGLAVFSGFAIATAIVLFVAAWIVFPAASRAMPIALGAVTVAAGMIAGIPALRTTETFFVLVVAWALVTGLIEGIAGFRAMRAADRGTAARSEARDGATVGAITVLLGLGLLLVPARYALQYYIQEAGQSFTLTGIAIGVGIFGGYAAIVGVYLAIAAFSPRRQTPQHAPVTPGAGTSAVASTREGSS